MLAFMSRGAFMRQRPEKLEVEGGLLRVGRGSSGRDLSLEAASWAGRNWDRGEPIVREGHRVGNRRREPADPSPKVFPSEVAHATGKLLRWDDKSRNSARSAIPWAARVADSAGQTLCPAELATGCGFDGRDLSSGT